MSIMADGEKSHSKSPGLSTKFQQMYKATSPSNPPWKEAYRKVLFFSLGRSLQKIQGHRTAQAHRTGVDVDVNPPTGGSVGSPNPAT